VYVPFAQKPHARSTILVRAQGAVARPIRELLRDEYPDLAVLSLVPFEEQLRRAMANQEMNAELSGGLGVLGLLLAGFGIFSVMSYTVSQRTREIGIRMAIGARRRDVGRWVLGEAGQRIGLGLALGVAGALAAARLLEGLLVGVEARDPWSFVLVPLVLGLVALSAAWLPSLRASRVEPIVALRSE
jgi:ABC-type antimicrobial peptide transport system permease subunit